MNKESCFTVFLFSSIQVFPAPIVWLLYLLQCWLSPRTPKGKYGCYYGLNTGRRHETMPLLFPRTLIHWKQLCRMDRQWVIPTSNRTSLAPKRHPKCIMLNFRFKHSPPRTIEQRGLKSFIEPSVVTPRAVGHPTTTPKRHYNEGIQHPSLRHIR